MEMGELEVQASSPFAGKPLKDSQFREQAGAMVVAIKRSDGKTVYSPTADTVLQPGDTLITIGRRGGIVSSQLM